MHQRAHCAALILPHGCGDPGNPIRRLDLLLIEALSAKLTSPGMMLDRPGGDGTQVDLTAEEARKIGKMGRLFNDRPLRLTFVPPAKFDGKFAAHSPQSDSDCVLVSETNSLSHSVSRVGCHDGQVVVVKYLPIEKRGVLSVDAINRRTQRLT